MSDLSADPSDEQSGAEQFDAISEEEQSLDDLPPDQLMGAEAYGAGGTETPDGVAERAARENPDRLPSTDRDLVAGLIDVDDPFEDDVTAESVADLSSDPSEPSPEESAMHSYSAEEAFDHGLDPDGPADDGYFDRTDPGSEA